LTKQAVIARFVDWNEAQMARGLLESNGIACYVGDSNIAAVEWGITLATGGIRLTVLDEADAAEAKRLLDDVRSGALDDALARFDAMGAPEADDVERCPACRSTNVFRPRSLLSALVTTLFIAPMPLLSDQRHCRACGENWTATA
jgi:hypothetical protein